MYIFIIEYQYLENKLGVFIKNTKSEVLQGVDL